MEDIVKYEEMFSFYENIYQDNDEVRDFLIQSDEPIYYKDLKIYPVKIKLYLFFQMFSACLCLKQHKVADIKALNLKYLDFLFYHNEKLGIDNRNYAACLKEVLYICLRLPREMETEDGKKMPTIDFIISNNNHLIKIYNKTYDARDFEKIRGIICKQNLIELPNPKVSEDIEKKYEEYISHLRKIGKIKTGDFEDLCLCMMSELGYSRQQIEDLTIRTFYKLLERIGFIMESKILRLLAPNMEKKDIEKIPNWTDKIPNKNKLEEMSADLQETENKIKGAK